MKPETKLFFYKAQSVKAKLDTICKIAAECFAAKQKLLIAVPNKQAAEFIDEMLWKSPPESFIPHCIISSQSEEKIAIAVRPKGNLNLANILLNLQSAVTEVSMQFACIYELLDETSEEKKQASHDKLETYRIAGLQAAVVDLPDFACHKNTP